MQKLQMHIGLLLLRLGVAATFALLLIFRQAVDRDALLVYPAHHVILPLLYVCTGFVAGGYFTKPAASAAALLWLSAALAGLRAGESWFALPIRDCEFAFLFAAIALTGPGRFSAERWVKLKPANDFS